MKATSPMIGKVMCFVLLLLTLTTIGQGVSLPKSRQDKPVSIPAQVINFSAGRSPEAILFDGTDIWVANQFSDNVMKLSASDGTILGTFPTGNKPAALAYDGENIWVANSQSASVTKLRASDGTVLETIGVGISPHHVVFDGASIWVTNSTSSTIWRLGVH